MLGLTIDISPQTCISLVRENRGARSIFIGLLLFSVLAIYWIYFTSNLSKGYKNNTKEIFPGVSTPLSAGKGEYGTAKWLSKKQQNKIWATQKISKSNPVINYLVAHGHDDMGGKLIHTKMMKFAPRQVKLEIMRRVLDKTSRIEPLEDGDFKILPQGGLLLGKIGNTYFYIDKNKHTLIIGSTGSGKTRCLVLPSFVVQILSGHSVIASDPKGEIYLSTYPFLKRCGIETVVLNFENPTTGNHYNFLQPVIDAIDERDLPKAIDETWTIVSSLVGKPKGEPLWNNGETSMLACGILAVAYDNRDEKKRQYQNLTNVYHFLSNMCTPVIVENRQMLPLETYLNQMPDTHPAKALVGIANVAPERTKGSFFTSALSTLRLFTNPYIYEMTRYTDFDYKTTGEKQRALFLILPDEKTAYYSVASLFVFQHYQTLVASARRNGGSCEICTEFDLDELGNFTEMPDFDKLMTVSRSRNIRFNLYLQDTEQLVKTYGKETAKIIEGNCDTWIYLQTSSDETRDKFSKMLGKYTIKVPSGSSSASTGSYSSSASYNLTGRELLTAEEIGKLQRPYHLVWTLKGPAVLTLPDISQTLFNDILGMGSEKFNKAMLKRRADKAFRTEKKLTMRDIKLWGIWRQYMPGYAGEEDEDLYEDFDPKGAPLPFKQINKTRV